ncbi:hypothetical protein ULMS_14410 [Patiriisocius marinistellae]|uniref:Bacteriocin-protection protein n=1 Tax=Patiriisocius marinistellae TaxID=2494560 RepID=A0A5J4FVJ2_9FLAO|nr:YdeI/OmpD-associated family protein [Patiriisocius marinistellae]GEQ85933.1 hypothetical protein ULMS_14410 [Patiriisocius marinistellae]
MEKPLLYFPRDTEWYNWLLLNHDKFPQGVYLVLYKIDTGIHSMLWEEAVRVALCFGWIDSTVKSLGNGKRQQFFSPRNPKSTWSALNKLHIKELENKGLIQEAGWSSIQLAKNTGTWTAMDGPEKGTIPPLLQKAFTKNKDAFAFYKSITPGYQKNYLRWLATAKKEETQLKRIAEIIKLCENKVKSRN